jgi:excisionase family DNA binding protein
MPRIKIVHKGVSEYMPLQEVQKLLGVSSCCVVRLIKSGQLPAIRVGDGKRANYRVLREDFKRFFEKSKTIKSEANQDVSEEHTVPVTDDNKSEYLKVRDIVRRLAVHGGTVTRLITRGLLPAIKVGNSSASHYRIRREDFEKFLEEAGKRK